VPICERFGCLPSQLDEEDPEIFRLVTLYDKAHPGPEQEKPR
jgi:hypothetical protein